MTTLSQGRRPSMMQ